MPRFFRKFNERCRRWTPTLGPILVFDLIRTARTVRFFVVRVAVVTVLSLLFAWMWWLCILYQRFHGATAILLEAFFAIFLFVQFTCVGTLTPASTAAGLAEEMKRRTLELLLATDLRGHEIVLSKILGSVASITMLLIATLPILCLLPFYGGPGIELIVAGFLMLGATTASIASLSLLLAVYRSSSATARFIILCIGYLVLSFWSSGLLNHAYLPRYADFANVADKSVLPGLTLDDCVTFLNAGNPYGVLMRLVRNITAGVALGSALLGVLGDYLAFHGLLALICVVWASVRIHAVSLRQLNGLDATIERGPHCIRMRVGAWPILWKEAFFPGYPEKRSPVHGWARHATHLFVALLFALPLAVAIHVFESGPWLEQTQLINVALACFVTFAIYIYWAVNSNFAVFSLQTERNRLTLDSLLTTPLSNLHILFGKWLGTILAMRSVWSWLLLVWISGLFLGGLSFWAVPRVVAVWLVYAALIASIGLWFSIIGKSTQRAVMYNSASGMALIFGHWAFWLIYAPFLLLVDEPNRIGLWLLQLHVGFTPLFVIFFLALRSDPAADVLGFQWEDIAGFAFVGLTLWAIFAVLVFLLALKQFAVVYHRAERCRPDVERDPNLIGADNTKQLRRKRRASRWKAASLAIGGALVLLAVIGAYYRLAWVAERDLLHVIDQLNAAEPGWQLPEIEAARTTIVPAMNAANVVIESAKLIPPNWPGPPFPVLNTPSWFLLLLRHPPDVQLDSFQTFELTRDLQALGAALLSARKLAVLPRGRFPLDRDADFIAESQIQHWWARKTAFLLWCHALLMIQKSGDFDDANRALFHTATAFDDEPVLQSLTSRLAIQNLALDAIERRLAQSEPTDAELLSLQVMLEQEMQRPVLLDSFRGDRAICHEQLWRVEEGNGELSRLLNHRRSYVPGIDLSTRSACQRAHAWTLNRLTEACAIASLPVHNQVTEFREFEKRTVAAPWIGRLFTPIVVRSADAYARGQSRLRCTIAAVALERHRRRHGDWPATLNILELKDVLIDPFSGDALHYRRLEQSIAVYSVGPDGKDNAGRFEQPQATWEGLDIGIRLWDVGERRKRPLNPEIGPPRPAPSSRGYAPMELLLEAWMFF